jgi:thimet oligopeptidase
MASCVRLLLHNICKIVPARRALKDSTHVQRKGPKMQVRFCVGLLLMWCCMLARPAAHAEVAYVFPTFGSAAQVDTACHRLVARSRLDAQRLKRTPEAQLLPKFDAITRHYEDTAGPFSLLAAVHPTKALRDAAERCDIRYQVFQSVFFQNTAIYQVLKNAVFDNAIDQRYQRDLLDTFEDAGVALTPPKKRQVQQLSQQIARLTQQFERRIREDKTQLTFTPQQLEGVPADVLKKVQHGYQVGLDAPTAQAVLSGAHQSSTRERYWHTYARQGGMRNMQLLDHISQLRRTYAKALGFASYAEFALRRRMAKTPLAVDYFLSTVKQAVDQRERDDLSALQNEKNTVQPSAPLQRWDVAYYLERVRSKKFHIDSHQLRTQLPPEPSMQWLFRIAQQMFGIRFELQTATLWHPEARAYHVIDIAQQRPLGLLIVDLFPRADKYNHAAVWSFRNSAATPERLPAAALVVNINRQGLSLNELETLLHEFGHALHSLLSRTRYAAQGGTNTALDFVEAPSQMLEDWAYDPQVLALMQSVCAECPPIAPQVLARAAQARDFGKGIQVGRQHVFASFDLALHGPAHTGVTALWQTMEGQTPLGYVPGSLFPASFSHIAGGYAAGYYSYLWSQVVAEDLRTAFAADKLSSSVGQRYRDTVLSQGAQRLPQDMVQNFLGRLPNSDAFFKALGRP